MGDGRLVAMTGYGRDQDRARGAEAGFDVYLVKPIEGARLLELLDELAPRSPGRRAEQVAEGGNGSSPGAPAVETGS